MRIVLGIAAMNTSGNVAMQPMLLLLLVLAVVLILVGCCIALLTLKIERKDKRAFITVENSDSRTKTH
jgi:hypothetical protein